MNDAAVRFKRAAQAGDGNRWHATLENLPQMVWSMSADGEEVYFNSRWIEFTGVMPELPTTPTWLQLMHQGDRDRALGAWNESFSTDQPYDCEYRLWHISGCYRWVHSRGLPEKDARGRVIRWYGTVTDVHERVQAMRTLRESEAFNRSIVETTPDSVALLDAAGKVIFANRAFAAAVDADNPAEIIGHSWLEYIPADGRAEATEALSNALGNGFGRFTIERQRLDNPEWWDIVVAPVARELDGPTRLVIIARDLTQQKLAEQNILWIANHDALTQLPNRTLFRQRLDRMIAESANGARSFAMLLLDIDYLKRTNDTFGHDAGDALLRCFAARLTSTVKAGDIVARLGGDEFAILLANASDPSALTAAAARVRDQLCEPCLHERAVLDCHASIGASLYPQIAASAEEMIKQADVALYAAKASGRSAFKVFEPAMQVKLQTRNAMLERAKDALRNNAIVPYYQPKVDMRTKAIIGFEALLRLLGNDGSIQMAGTIAAAFEDSAVAMAISECMIDRVLTDLLAWKSGDVDIGHIAINASAAEFRTDEFAERLLAKLKRAKLSPNLIQLEITESVFLSGGADCIERALGTLSAAGVRIALDDFGTGYASLSHLKRFPVDIIKIDRSFIRDLQVDEGDGAIVDAVIGLGKSLKIEIVAEGIETAAQHDALEALGCDYGQGYLYSPAVSASEIPDLLRSNKTLYNRRAKLRSSSHVEALKRK